MRVLPFMKRKNGIQFAGVGLDTGGGGGGGDPYVLPTATANRLGGVKVGAGLEVTSDGTLSASGGGGGGGVAYSTTEHAVGTWLDGSTVYEKTLTYNFQSAGESASVLLTNSDIKYVEMRGCIKSENETYQIFADTTNYDNTAFSTVLSYGATNIRAKTGRIGTLYLTVRYVKN